MLPALVAHNLSENTIRDIQGDFLSNNKTRISIRVGSAPKRALKARRRPSAAPCRESPQIPIAHPSELSFVRSREYQSDLVAHDGYCIHLAKYLGKVVAVKVYQGENSAERLEADLELNRSLFHPTIFQTIAVSKASQTPFLVLSMESNSSQTIPISFGSFKSLVCYLADALSHSETESLVAGAQLIRDISSGLDYLASIEQIVAVSRLTFDLLVDENNNVCISVGLREEDETGTQENEYLDVFHNLCIRGFLEANNECYSDDSQMPTIADLPADLPEVPDSSDDIEVLLPSQREDEMMDLGTEIVLQPMLPPTPPRREYAFIPDPSSSGRSSLRQISADYARLMRRLNSLNSPSKAIRRLRHKGLNNSESAVAHRCAGYRRDEVTLSTLVSRTAIIQHLTPSLREICPVCHQLVENGIFNCSCGQGDDGLSPTIQCSLCSVWSHRDCQVDSGANRPLCADCLGSSEMSPDEESMSQAKPQAEVVFSSDVRDIDEWARRTRIPLTTAEALHVTYARAHRWLQNLRMQLIHQHNWKDSYPSDQHMLFALETLSIRISSVGLPAGPTLRLQLPVHASSFFSPERRVQWQMVFHSDIFASVREICPPINDILSLVQCLLTGLVTLVFDEHLPQGVYRTTRGLPPVSWINANESALTDIFGTVHFKALRRACNDTETAFKLEILPQSYSLPSPPQLAWVEEESYKLNG